MRTQHQRIRARFAALMTGLFAAVMLAASPVSNALALPPGGAAPDSPGTSSSVSSSTVTRGDVLNFEVHGFPANHVISVKIADGEYCGSGVAYGSCVVARVQADASGNASGSIVIPDDLTNGSYWLRFLTDTPATSNRGNSDFKVVTATSGTTGTSGNASSGSVAGAAGAATSGTANSGNASANGAGEGEGTSSAESPYVIPEADAAVKAESITDDELPIAGAAYGSDEESEEAVGADGFGVQDAVLTSLTKEGFPWAGAIVLLVTLVGAALAVWNVRRGKAEALA